MRPVGTEFWYEFPVSTDSNDCRQHRYLYRVTEHVTVARFSGDKVGQLIERLEPLRLQSRPITGVDFDGNYLFGEWAEGDGG